MYGVYGSGASHYREGATMGVQLVKVGQIGALDLEAVGERATRFPCPEMAIRLALAKAGVRFRVAAMRNGSSSTPHLLLEIVKPISREQKEVLREAGPLPKQFLVGPLLFKPES